MTRTALAAVLLDWYAQHRRDLPWRRRSDAYAVWVAEIMLQQTRVETVIPYYERWMQRFPDLAALAQASQQEVLAAWEGLGYYSRARSLHSAAQQVQNELGGQIPSSAAALSRLPGIGRYTAGAIASIAFGQDAAALDGNLRRVLARVFNVTEPARSPAGERRLWALAEANLPAGAAGDYNQALMDLASSICTPRKPGCARCPLQPLCQAYALGVQEQRPVLEKKHPVPHYLVAAAVIRRGGLLLLAQRPAKGLLGGLWEFPGGKLQPGEDLPTCLAREIREELDAGIDVHAHLGVYRHAYTHFKVTLHAFECTLQPGQEPRPVQAADVRWVTPPELTAYPMGKIDRQIARSLLGEPPFPQPAPGLQPGDDFTENP
ncbi:MAG: A/G-specific adenine glycosylase [Chloroflexota bacterium]